MSLAATLELRQLYAYVKIMFITGTITNATGITGSIECV